MTDPAPATRTELAVLGLLAWSGESSGYELDKRAGRTIGFIWSPARSQLYAVLKRLEKAGLVSGRQVAQASRPDKRMFSVTRAGMAALRQWLDNVEEIAPGDREGVLLKLFFGTFGDPDAGRRQLIAYRRGAAQQLAAYREIERTFDDEPERAALHRLQTLRLGIALMQATLAWADETLEILESSPAAIAIGAPAGEPGSEGP